MGENNKIEWCGHTFNPWIGCQKVSPGCDHCYTEHLVDHRFGWVQWGPHGQRKRTSDDNRRKPRRWAKDANGHRPRVFCGSLADWLDNQAPREWRFEPSTSAAECGWLAGPVKAGLRPPPSAAYGLDRACHPAFVCHQAVDGQERLISTQVTCQLFSRRHLCADSDSHPHRMGRCMRITVLQKREGERDDRRG